MTSFPRSPRRLPKPFSGTWMLGLAWLALACRVIIPAGYMPAAQAGGLQWLTLCSPAGQTRTVAVALFEGADERGDVPALQAEHCAFAAQAAGQAMPPPAPGLMSIAAPFTEGRPHASRSAAPRYFERGKPLGARAPPRMAA